MSTEKKLFEYNVVAFRKNNIVVETRTGKEPRVQRTPRSVTEMLIDIHTIFSAKGRFQIVIIGWNQFQYAIPLCKALSRYMFKPSVEFMKIEVSGELGAEYREVEQFVFKAEIDNLPALEQFVSHSRWLDAKLSASEEPK